MLQAMLSRPEPNVLVLAFTLLHEHTKSDPLRANATAEQVRSRMAQYPDDLRLGPLLRTLIAHAPPQYKGDLLCLAATGSDSTSATLVLDEIRSNGLHAGLCARALLTESIDTQSIRGVRRGFNALLLAAGLSSPTFANHSDLLVATIIQLCAPIHHEKGRKCLLEALEGSHSSVRRQFDRLIISSSDRRVRERLIPLLSVPSLRRSARASLERCSPTVIESACRHAGHRIHIGNRLSLLANSAIALQFISALKTMTPYDRSASLFLASCLTRSTVDDVQLESALSLASKADSPFLKWKSELEMSRRSAGRSRSSSRSTVDDLQEFGATLHEHPIWLLGARARILMDRHPDAFIALLRRYLSDEFAEQRLVILQVIGRARLASKLEPELLEIAEDVGSELTAEHRRELVRLFATTGSSRGAAYVFRSMVDADVRVQESVFQVLSSPETRSVGDGSMMTELLKRVACTAESTVRKAALKALRARSRASFESLMDTLLNDDSGDDLGLVLDAALHSKRPIASRILRLLEKTNEESVRASGPFVLRMLHARNGPWIECSRGQVAV